MANRNTRTAAAAAGIVLAMVGLVAASVPLYELFCRVTGYGGTTRTAAAAPASASTREVVVRFDTTVMRDLGWEFRPVRREIRTRLGETALAYFRATNLSDRAVTGTATFNVAPAKAGRYFNKIECFCFTAQRLEPGQSIEMPVSFFVDPALALDADTEEIGTITLAYTFFKAPEDPS